MKGFKNLQKVICLGDKAEKVISFEVGKSKTSKVTNCKVESKAIDSPTSLTEDNKDFDSSRKANCLEDKAEIQISFEAGEDFTLNDILVLVFIRIWV